MTYFDTANLEARMFVAMRGVEQDHPSEYDRNKYESLADEVDQLRCGPQAAMVEWLMQKVGFTY